MSSTDSTLKTQRTRTARKANSKPAKKAQAKTTAASRMASPEQRRSMIAEFAYLRAERRGFQAGDPTADWLESEKEVDALLSGGSD